MRPIDGDRLKAFLNDTEKTLKRIGKVFAITQNAIDWMPTLETRGED